MKMILKKVFREMTIKYKSTLVAILALSVGIWGIGSLLVSLHIMSNDLTVNFTQTIPEHVVIKSDDFHKLNLDTFIKNPEIQTAAFRDKTILRVEVFKDQWLPLWLYSVDDFDQMSMAKFFHQTGCFPPAKGTIAIERNAQLISNLKLQSFARVQSKGKIITTPISGIVFDPGQAPATQDAFVYAYTDRENYTKLTGASTAQRLIIRFNNVKTKKEVKEKFKIISREFADVGIKIDSFSISNFNEHPHQFQLNTLLYLNGTIGLLAFIMAMVLVSQLMNSILAQQVRQIGIMKAIGASSFQILLNYLSYILIMSSISIIIGLPLAIITGKAYASFVAGILNFDILTIELPTAIYFAIILLGFSLPILFSLPALRKAMNTTVTDALNDYGLTIKRESNVTFKVFSNNSNIFLLSCRNVWRRKYRMVVIMFTIALGAALFLTGFNVRSSLFDFLENTSQSMKYDIKVVLNESIPLSIAQSKFIDIEAVKSVDGWVGGGGGRLQSEKIYTPNGIGFIAAPFDTKLKTYEMLEGTWLTGGSDLEFVVNPRGALEFKPLIIGKTYPIFRKNEKQIMAKLAGVVREFDVPKIYVDIDKYQSIVNPKKNINSLMISLTDRSYDNVISVKKEIEQIVEKSGLDVAYVMSHAERGVIIFNHLDIILTVILFLSLLVLFVAFLGFGSAMGINVVERTREIGVLRAIGATPKIIFQIFLVEGMIISVAGLLIGLIISLPLSNLGAIFFGELILGENTPLYFSFNNFGFGLTLLITVFWGYIASRAPATKATFITVREAIAYE